jgi:SdpI/YfhL protein family
MRATGRTARVRQIEVRSHGPMYVLRIILAIMNVFVGLLFLGFLRPLVQRKIGRSGLYGFRTPKTLASDEVWYAVNHGAAKKCMYLAIGVVIFGIVLALLPSKMSENMEDIVLFAGVAVPNVMILGLMVAPSIELKKLDR